jgi:hypothetical protein
MPPKTRASAISATTAEKLGKLRVPDLISEVTVTAVLSPNLAANMYAAAPLTVECPEGYSGCAGVPDGKKSSQGVQVGSESVLALSRTALIGRQKTYRYLLSQHAIAASAMATLRSANRCAFCARLSDLAVATWSAILFQYRAELPVQKSASSDWSLDRGAPLNAPIILVSL